MLKHATAIAIVTAASGLVPVPPTPAVTPTQQEVIAKTQQIAAAAQPQAKLQLLQMLDDDNFKRFMKNLNSEHAGKTNTEIYQLLSSQLEVAEVVHNWNPYPGHQLPNIVDITIDSSIGYPVLFTNWQLSALGLNPPAGNTALQNTAEVELFFCPNFTQFPPDYSDASNRFPYGAMNIQKLAGGNPKFGSVSTVFKNTYIRNQTTLVGWDSGQIEMACNNSLPNYINITLDCEALQAVGTFDHWEQAFVGNAVLPNTTIPILANVTSESLPSYNLAMRVAAFLSSNYSNTPNVTGDTVTAFIEADPMMNVEWANGVKMLILNYRSNLFGTWIADLLRNWTISQNWVLVWANEPGMGEAIDSLNYQSNQRFVDPVVLLSTGAGRNYSTDPDIIKLREQFVAHYSTVNKTLPVVPEGNLTAYYKSQWEVSWSLFSGSKLQVQPLFANSCSNPDCAVVRVIDKACICN